MHSIFENETDREIFCFLLMVRKFADKEITNDEFMQYIEADKPEEQAQIKHKTGSKTRKEQTTEIINQLQQLNSHIYNNYGISVL